MKYTRLKASAYLCHFFCTSLTMLAHTFMLLLYVKCMLICLVIQKLQFIFQDSTNPFFSKIFKSFLGETSLQICAHTAFCATQNSQSSLRTSICVTLCILHHSHFPFPLPCSIALDLVHCVLQITVNWTAQYIQHETDLAPL